LIDLEKANNIAKRYENPTLRFSFKEIDKSILTIGIFFSLFLASLGVLNFYNSIDSDLLLLPSGLIVSTFFLAHMYMKQIKKREDDFYLMLVLTSLFNFFCGMVSFLFTATLFYMAVHTIESFIVIDSGINNVGALLYNFSLLIAGSFILRHELRNESNSMTSNNESDKKDKYYYSKLIKQVEEQSESIEKNEYYLKASRERKYEYLIDIFKKQQNKILGVLNFKHIDEYYINKIENNDNNNEIENELKIENE